MSFLDRLLEHYQINIKDLDQRKKSRSFTDLVRPECSSYFALLRNIKAAIYEKAKIVIYGDYDVDGISSTVILVKAFNKLGIKVGYFIPSRYIEGYGLNKKRIDDFYNKGYNYIITVDNGIVCNEEIDYAHSLSMKVLVIDHHNRGEKCHADAVFHFDDFLDYNCSAASLAYFVYCGLVGKDDEYCAFLAGLAVYSDVMPLVNNNLTFLKLAKDFYNKRHYPNISSFLPYNAEYSDFSYKLIPSLNAVGRIMKDQLATNRVARFLLEEKKDQSLSSYIMACNLEKKRIISLIDIDEKNSFESEYSFSTLTSIDEGLTSLLANRLLREKEKATLVCTESKEDELVGSLRSFKNVDLLPFLENEKKITIKSGGHKQACGVTIKKKDYYRFVTDFASYCNKMAMDNKTASDYITIDLSSLNKENYEILKSFEPFGNSFEEPKFLIHVDKDELISSKNNKAIFAYSENKEGRVIIFKNPEEILQKRYTSFDLIGEFTKSIFNNTVTYDLKVEKIIPHCD